MENSFGYRLSQITKSSKIIINSNRLKQLCWGLIRFVVIFGLCFEIIYPFIVKILQMFMDRYDLVDPTVKIYPKHISMYFIQKTIDLLDYPANMMNTAMVTIPASVIQTFICTMVGYGFARFKFKGRGIIFTGILLTLLIPPQVYSTSMYLSFRFFNVLGIGNVNLIDSSWPFVILSITGLGLRNGLYIYIMRQFFKGMPKELEEAAYIDGYGPYATFFKIMIPNARNMIITIMVLSFAWQWTDVFYSTLFSLKSMTLPVAVLQNIRMVSAEGRLDPVEFSVLRNTACILTILPLIVLFGIAQKKLIQGIERSGIVG